MTYELKIRYNVFYNNKVIVTINDNSKRNAGADFNSLYVSFEANDPTIFNGDYYCCFTGLVYKKEEFNREEIQDYINQFQEEIKRVINKIKSGLNNVVIR